MPPFRVTRLSGLPQRPNLGPRHPGVGSIRMRTDKLHKAKLFGELTHHGRPAKSRVAQAVEKDERGAVLRCGLYDDGSVHRSGERKAALG